MPPVTDVPEIVEQAEYALYEEQPQAHTAHPGFWHTLREYVRRQRVHRLQSTSSSDRSALRQLESPMARLAQEHPMLYLLGFFGMNNG
jgi:hypothetical protein